MFFDQTLTNNFEVCSNFRIVKVNISPEEFGHLYTNIWGTLSIVRFTEGVHPSTKYSEKIRTLECYQW